MSAAEQLRIDRHLRAEANPFGSGATGPRVSRPLQAALGEVIRHIGLETSVIIVAGSAGTGKTMLMDMIGRACTNMGLSARQVERGDLVDIALGERSDVLVVDEADSITDSTLQTLLSPEGEKTATSLVFLCLPSSVYRFGNSATHIVELHQLSVADAQGYLLERANSIGRPDLFAPDALDLVVYGSRGSPRLLRSIASLAFFGAACDGESQITLKYVAYALASQVTQDADKPDTPAPRNEPSVDTAAEARSMGRRFAPVSARPALKVVSEDAEKGEEQPAAWVWARERLGLIAGGIVALAVVLALAIMLPSWLSGGNTSSVEKDSSRNATIPIVPNSAPAKTAVAPAPAAAPTTRAAEPARSVASGATATNQNRGTTSTERRPAGQAPATANARPPAPVANTAPRPAAPVTRQAPAPVTTPAPAVASRGGPARPAPSRAAPTQAAAPPVDPYSTTARGTAEQTAAALAAQQEAAAQAAAAQAAAAQKAAEQARITEEQDRLFQEALNRAKAAEVAAADRAKLLSEGGGQDEAERRRQRAQERARTLFNSFNGLRATDRR